MTDEQDTLARLVAYHDHIAVPPEAADHYVRLGRRRVRRNRGLLTGGVALAVAVVAIAVPTLDGGRLADQPQPVAPRPTVIVEPSPTGTDWSGSLLRPDRGSLPVITMIPGEAGDVDEVWTDAQEEVAPGIDIGSVHSALEQWAWTFELREAPRGPSALDQAQQTLEYGVVVDGDGDRTADCWMAITNIPQSDDFTVRVTNLRTGVTDERDGPPYGIPVEFSHPFETDPGDVDTSPGTVMSFTFLSSPPTPCDDLIRGSANFYTYAGLHGFDQSGRGVVLARDYAPDAAWLANS